MTRLERGLLLASCFVATALLVPLTVLVRDGWGPLRRADSSAEDALDLPHGVARDVALVVTQLGAPLLLEAAALVLVVLLVRRNRRRLAAFVAVSVFGAELLSALTKLLVSRVRPCADLVSCPHSTSFPSGHAVGAAAFWATIAVLLLPKAGKKAWLLLVVPPVVALTRVLLGVHYPSDVLAGLVMGGCWAAAWTAVFAAWREQRRGRDLPLEEGVG